MLCAAQTQCAFFIPEIDSSRNSKQLRIKGTYYVSTSKTQTFLWFKITSIYLPGHEVAGAQEGAKTVGYSMMGGFPGLKKKCKLQLYFTSGAQFALSTQSLVKTSPHWRKKSWRTEIEDERSGLDGFDGAVRQMPTSEFALLLTLASLLSDSSWGN